MRDQTISVADALALIDRDESHFWDHKSAKCTGTTIEKIASALANADGGEFIVGIEDRSSASGLDRWVGFEAREDANFVVQALAMNVTPPVPYDAEWLQLEGHSQRALAFLVSIRKSESVHSTSANKVYVRRGAQSLPIEGQAVTDLTLSKGARSYEDQALDRYSGTDLETESELRYFLDNYSPATKPDDFTHKQRLVVNGDQATVAAAILFAESPPAVMPKRCAVKIARYATKDAEPDRRHLTGVPMSIEGPARLVIDDAIRLVTELVESVSVMLPTGAIVPVRYPPEVLKEIIVNAVIHRDYNVSDDILVLVFDNRVEVRSPGGLPGHVTLKNLLNERFARNPTIVRLLNKYPNPPNKDIGEGLNTAVAKMAEARLKSPEFAVENNYFVATVGHTPLARPQEIVLEYLASHPTITNSIARGLTGITSENSMKEVFYSLRKAGKLEQVPGLAGSRSAWRRT